MKKFLLQHGFRITTVSDGNEMHRALRDWKIDLVILDIMLPGEDGFAQARALFARYGGWTVAGSRWLPVLPEMVSFLAGLTGMSARRYLAALACGSVPLGFVFATAGHIGADNPIATMLLSALAPLALWALVRPFLATAS